MASYISSNANRFYVAAEASYGQPAAITAGNRFPAVRLQAQQLLEKGRRADKTGTRTFLGTSSTSRRQTAFEIRTYLTSWTGVGEPSYGPLFHAAMGSTAQFSSGLVIASVQNAGQLTTTAAHNLAKGSGVSFAGEIRFVTAVPSSTSLVLNAPFSSTPAANGALNPTVSYRLATGLPSVTLYDYWDPTTATSRMVSGAAVNQFQVAVNGDFHEFVFAGPAADLLDSQSFVAGSAGLPTYPGEPTLSTFDHSIVPGHLGQVWLGSSPNQFFTLTEASLGLKNSIDLRNHEFGSSYPAAIAPGPREVMSSFSLFAQDDAQTAALYVAAKQRQPISAMLQLGQQQGQLMGMFLGTVIPEIPAYNDSETRLQWQFKNNQAQGTAEDEIYIAFA